MRRHAGFTLIETTVAITLFAAGSVFVYSTFAGVTKSSQTATLQIDLGSANKVSLTRIYNELQASSLKAQDTDGLDSTEPVGVFEILADNGAPAAHTVRTIVQRNSVGTAVETSKGWEVGETREQARERNISQSKRLRFRKVIGYQFNASSGTIMPEWSGWITFSVNPRRQLVRTLEGQAPRVIANHVDALDAEAMPDGTVLLTLVTAKPAADGHGWKRYANSVTIHPKN